MVGKISRCRIVYMDRNGGVGREEEGEWVDRWDILIDLEVRGGGYCCFGYVRKKRGMDGWVIL